MLRKELWFVIISRTSSHDDFISLSSFSSQVAFLPFSPPHITGPVAMEMSSVASASSEAGSTRSQEIEELERFIDSYILDYQVQGLLRDKEEDLDNGDKVPQVRTWLFK